MSKRLVWSMMLILSMVLAACGKEDITAENIMTKMQETQANTTDLHAVVRTDFTSPEQTGALTVELWTHKTGQKDADGKDVTAMRMKVLEASDTKAVGTEAVFNGDAGWLYAPDENTAYVGSRADLDHEMPSGGNTPTDPAQAMQQLQQVVQMGLDALNIEILGEEVVAGHNAYKLDIKPKPEMQEQLQLPIELLLDATLWVDSERWMPLKLVLDAKDMGNVSIVAQTLELNPALDVTMFDAQPPAGATIVNIADEMKKAQPDRQPMTLDEAKAQAGFPVLVPAATGDATLIDVQMLRLPQGNTVVQLYSGSTSEWSLVQSQGEQMDRAGRGAKGTEVEVRGTNGTLIEGRGNVGVLLTWQENGVNIVLAGNVTSEQALEIANSLQ